MIGMTNEIRKKWTHERNKTIAKQSSYLPCRFFSRKMKIKRTIINKKYLFHFSQSLEFNVVKITCSPFYLRFLSKAFLVSRLVLYMYGPRAIQD